MRILNRNLVNLLKSCDLNCNFLNQVSNQRPEPPLNQAKLGPCSAETQTILFSIHSAEKLLTETSLRFFCLFIFFTFSGYRPVFPIGTRSNIHSRNLLLFSICASRVCASSVTVEAQLWFSRNILKVAIGSFGRSRS